MNRVHPTSATTIAWFSLAPFRLPNGPRLTALAACGWIASSVLLPAADSVSPAGTGFRWAAVDDKSLGLWEGEKPVLVYNHRVLLKPGVPADRARSTYLHPIYGLDGEVLTDDFPKDHYHHRGLFWAWPHVKVDDKEASLWDLRGIEQRFVKWLQREASPEAAGLGVENGWFVGDQQVLREEVWLRVRPATSSGRAIDLDLTLTPLGRPVTLQGAEGKSYGGLTLRFAPRQDTVITTPQGNRKEDLVISRLPWADLSARFEKAAGGAAIFIAPDHPDYPPTWLTRHYGVLCVGWPGVKAGTLPPDQPVTCRYRVWLHRGTANQGQLQEEYDRYVAGLMDARK